MKDEADVPELVGSAIVSLWQTQDRLPTEVKEAKVVATSAHFANELWNWQKRAWFQGCPVRLTTL
jgi:hypothetical protein